MLRVVRDIWPGPAGRIGTPLVAAATAVLVAALAGCGGDSSASEMTGPGSPASTTASKAAGSELSDTGLGDLKLGMSLRKAQALGLVGKAEGVSDKKVCDPYAGENGVKDLVFTNDKLIIIVAGPKIRLDTDLGIGSTYEQLHQAYGERLGSIEGEPVGRVYITAPKAPIEALYRIGLNTGYAYRDSKITKITLQSTAQTCYE